MIDEIEREEIYDFLEHHGVAGMKWGVRNARSSSSPKKPKTPEQKKATRDKILKGIEIAGVVAAGAIIANYMVKKHSATKMKQVKSMQSNLAQTKRLMDQKQGVFMRDLGKQVRSGKVSPGNYDPLRKSLDRNIVAETVRRSKQVGEDVASRQNASTRLVNKQLKVWFDQAQVPLHAREYITG